jgi:hypothetical protein
MIDSKLAAKVAAVNLAHQVAKDLYPAFVAALTPFLGQKVQKADGTLLAKVEKVLPKLPNGPGLIAYVKSGKYNLTVGIRANENYGGIAMYHEVSLYVADVTSGGLGGTEQPGVLTRFYDAPDHRSDYTTAEIADLRRKYEAAKKIADAAKSAISDFGEYD